MYNIIQLNKKDNIGLAPMPIPKDSQINNFSLISKNEIPYGHKISLDKINKDSFIFKYGQIIGIATKDILAGEHVHSHNLSFTEFERVYEDSKKYETTKINKYS
jgi:hypothetical protein